MDWVFLWVTCSQAFEMDLEIDEDVQSDVWAKGKEKEGVTLDPAEITCI
jgi:hypothetical protein